MQYAQKQVLDLLQEHGAKQEGFSKGHPKYKLPSGRNWIIPAHQGDIRSWENNLHELQRVLGLQTFESKSTQVLSKDKKHYHKPHHRAKPMMLFLSSPDPAAIQPSFRDKLRSAVYGSPITQPPLLSPLPERQEQDIVRHRYRRPSERVQHGAIRIYSEREIALLNQVSKEKGPNEVQIILNTVHSYQFNLTPITPPQEDDIMNTTLLQAKIEEWKQQADASRQESLALIQKVTEADERTRNYESLIKAGEEFLAKIVDNAALIDETSTIASNLFAQHPKATAAESVNMSVVSMAVAIMNDMAKPALISVPDLVKIISERYGREIKYQTLYSALDFEYKKGKDSRLTRIKGKWGKVEWHKELEHNVHVHAKA